MGKQHLPAFLLSCIEKGIIDESTAYRIEEEMLTFETVSHQCADDQKTISDDHIDFDEFDQVTSQFRSRIVDELTVENSGPSPESDFTKLFKTMLIDAETEQEQALALQIALNERVRQLKQNGNSNKHSLENLENALRLLRDGRLEEAVLHIKKAGDRNRNSIE